MNQFWWIDPSKLLIFLILPLFVLSGVYGAVMLPEFGTYNFLSRSIIMLGAFCIAILALGARIGAVSTNRRDFSRIGFDPHSFDMVLMAALFACLVANVLYLAPVLTNPSLILSMLAGEKGANFVAKESLLRLPGLTSLTNIAGLVFTMAAIRFLFWGRFAPNFLTTLALILLAGLVVAHAILGSERIVIIECAVAFGVPMFSFWPRLRKIGVIAPVVGAVAILSLFAYGEYLRSWAYYMSEYDSFPQYVGTRLLAYVAVASNTGAGMLTQLPPVGFPLITGRWFSRLPVLGFDNDYMGAYLRDFGNIEYNNPSGVFAALVDFGTSFGLAYLFAFGLLIGFIYGLFRHRHPIGLLTYPLLFTGLIDLTQIWYWGEPRFIPQVAFLALAIVFTIRRRVVPYAPA